MSVRVSIGSRRSVEESYDGDEDRLLSQSVDSRDFSISQADMPGNSYGAITPKSSTVIAMRDFDQFSAHTTCPFCQKETDTQLKHRTGTATFKCFALLTVLTCGLLSCLPFLLNDFKDVEHTCQHCGKTIATYRRKFISR